MGGVLVLLDGVYNIVDGDLSEAARRGGVATYATCGINVRGKLRVVAELGCPVKENVRNASIAVPRLDPDYPVRAFCVRILLGLS